MRFNRPSFMYFWHATLAGYTAAATARRAKGLSNIAMKKLTARLCAGIHGPVNSGLRVGCGGSQPVNAEASA